MTLAAREESDFKTLSVLESELHSSIYVEAGAGTGKTHSLVQRIMALLKGGVPIDEIIAITFTRAAASELRSRIRAELEVLQSESPDEFWIGSALERIDTAAFQTIDSLVHNILSEHALHAGLPPSIEVQDRFAHLEMFRERWRQWAADQLEQNRHFSEALSNAMRLKLSNPFNCISELAKEMNENHGDLETVYIPKPQRCGLQALENITEMMDELLRQMNRCSDDDDRLLLKMQEAEKWYETSVEGRKRRTEEEAETCLLNFSVKAGKSIGRAPNWGGAAGKADALEALRNIIDEVDNALNMAREAVTIELSKFAWRFVEMIVEERRKSGSVSYYDSITWLNKMLETNDQIRRSVQSRYSRVLVDEFQDTDPNQVKLVRLLTTPPGKDSFKPGSLFAVGDPKQSIYKFRGAEVAVSDGVKREVQSGGEGCNYLTLRENRRSTSTVINLVNHVFGKMMGSEEGQAEWIPLEMAEGTNASELTGSVRFFGFDTTDKKVDEVRSKDAVAVANIARAICAGALLVRDRHDDRTRPSAPGDLTILTRARSNWETYTRELDNLRLPYTAEIGGAAVFDTQEFRDLLNCLNAIDDPSDQPATVGALKSIYFGCSDVDLYKWAKAGGKFTSTSKLNINQAPTIVRQALGTLSRYHELRDQLPPALLIERFIRERQARESMFLNPDPAPGLRRLDLAVELARNFTEEGASSMRECLARFRQYREADEHLREEPSLEFDQGKIRLMTMHSSKGLEFPIVILADLSGPGGSRSPKLLTDNNPDSGNGFGVRLGGGSGKYFQTGDYEPLIEKDKRADELENTRLLYVACTRARDHLFISLFRKEDERNVVAAGRFADLIDEKSKLWDPIPSEWKSIIYSPTVESKPVEPLSAVDERETWIERHEKMMEQAAKPSWTTPSRLKSPHEKISERRWSHKADDVPISDSESQTSRGRAPTQIGRAVHASLQRILESGVRDVDAIARVVKTEATREDVEQERMEIERLASATLQTPLLQRIAKLGTNDVWVETQVATPIHDENGDTVALEGRVDLIYRLEDGTLGIADFKTDRSFSRSNDEMAEPYIPQMGAYAYAVEKATGMRVSQASIIFSRLAADRPESGEYQLPDVKAAMAQALKLVSNR